MTDLLRRESNSGASIVEATYKGKGEQVALY